MAEEKKEQPLKSEAEAQEAAEEKKEEKKQEVPEKDKEEKKDSGNDVAEPEKAESKTEAAPETSAPPVKKKVNKMTLAEVNAKLKGLPENQGGLESKYAQALLERKNYLESKK